MRKSSTNLWPVPTVLLCGLLAAVCCIGESDSAAAFGMFGFGRMGGYGRPGMGPPAWRRTPPPRLGGGFAGRSPGRGGSPSRHAPIVGGGAVGGGIVGGSSAGSRGNDNGGGAVPVVQGDQPFIPNEIITAFEPNATPQAIAQFARRNDLTQLESQSFPLIGGSLYRWRIGGNRTAGSVIDAVGRDNIVARVQPNYIFTLQQVAATSPAAGDAAQYVLAELQIDKAHQIATGKDVLIAVIDSEVDGKHPDLGGTIVKSFDALGGDASPHLHGTEMAGAIASHGKLLGIASDAHILAVHAFDDNPGIARGNSFAIYKALQWAADNGARIINMSFAGPADPMLRRFLAAASDKGIVLVAAAGNAGPQSEPLYPAADPNVIAVTATDNDDHVFKMANRGRYIAVAAPGVDILALAPGGAYQLTTGTSIAAAHVSGIAALLLERKPSLRPSDIRAVLVATAKMPGPPVPDSDFGAGLVNAYRAVTWLDHKAPGSKDDSEQAKQ
ncbi:MAG: S8 family serine peptidase [Xanthobacteraceae bacterium]